VNYRLKDYTVLYVEDDNEISEEVSFFLRAQVKELYTANNGEEGLDAYIKHKPDIIITDVQMPIMNGLKMVEKIREIDAEIPIIITTAFSDSDYLLKAINLHVDGYQTKPLDLKTLIKSLQKIIEPMELKAEIQIKNEQLAENNFYLKQFKNAVSKTSLFCSSDENGIIKEVNENFELISGYTREELIGQSHSMLRDKSVPKEFYEDMWLTIKSGKIWKGLIKNKRKSLKNYYVISEVCPIYNKDGSFREYISIQNDVTELEEYKAYLKHELSATNHDLDDVINHSNQYEHAINNSVAILKTNNKNMITYVNDTFCKISGYEQDEVIGKNCEEIRHEKHKNMQTCSQIQNKLENKEFVHEIFTNVKKDKTLYTTETFFYPIVDLEGNLIEYLHVMHDLTQIVQLNKEIIDTQKEVVLTMGAIVEARSQETGLHVKRVAEYSYLLAKLFGMSEDEASLLKQAAPMHDIGKVAIPDNILNKPTSLTKEEFEVMKTHAQIGYEMLKHSNREILKASSIVALTHHEKWNGKGYPHALKGEEIHIYGRITSIADVFDALGHDRVYKKAWELEDILSLFEKEKGVHFDPTLVELFFNNLDKFLEVKNSIKNY
jgi:PAS domain S-box-containing protein